MHRRRFALLAAACAAWPAVIRAQETETHGCTVGFVGGLLRFDPDCLMTPPGLPFAIAPPGHLATVEIDEAAMQAAVDEAEADDLARMQQRRDQRRDKRDRRGERKRNGKERHRDRKQRRRV